jgi:hypothetical protein
MKSKMKSIPKSKRYERWCIHFIFRVMKTNKQTNKQTNKSKTYPDPLFLTDTDTYNTKHDEKKVKNNRFLIMFQKHNLLFY